MANPAWTRLAWLLLAVVLAACNNGSDGGGAPAY